MKVSIIMPVYNAEKYVFEAIDSILKQTYTNFELLVFNDGSKDGSLAIIQSFNDSRIKLHHYENNIGYVQHLNTGLEIAEGDLIARMDADDISLPNRLKEQVDFMMQNPDVGLCGTMCNIIGRENEIIYNPLTHQEIYSELFWRNAFIHSSIMVRKSILNQHHLNYDIAYRPSEDYLFFAKLTMLSKSINLNQVLVSYRFHDNQVTITENDKSFYNAQNVRYYLIEDFISEALTEKEKEIFTHIMRDFNPNINPLELTCFLDRIIHSKKEMNQDLKDLVINRFKNVKTREIKRIYLWEPQKVNHKWLCLKLLFNKEIGNQLSIKEKVSAIKKLIT